MSTSREGKACSMTISAQKATRATNDNTGYAIAFSRLRKVIENPKGLVKGIN